MALVEVKVPDIGDFKDVAVIELLVQPGDTVKAEQSLVSVESDKASMEIPSSHAGVVKDVRVKLGDKLNEGSVIVTLEVVADSVAQATPQEPSAAAPVAASTASGDVRVASSGPVASAPTPVTGAERADVEVLVPDIGDFGEVAVIEVMVEPGDMVQVEQSLITVESDKASMEIPSSHAGVVKELRVKVGDKVSQGSVVVVVEAAAQASDAPASATVAPPDRAASTSGSAASAASAAAPAAAAATPAVEKHIPPTAALPAHVPAAPRGALPHASPTIRKFARELGVPLDEVKGTGPKGRIVQEDVQGFVKSVMSGASRTKAQSAGTQAGGAMPGLLPWPQVDFAKFGPIERRDLSRIKKISAANLHRNWVMIPHVTNHDNADITELEALRVQLNRENEKTGVKVTMLAFLIKASVAALKKFPDFNASLDGEQLVYKQYFHIGFAADTPNGLMVPVLKDADKKGVLQISQEMSELARRARDGKLGPADMSGGTFSISSLGGIGGRYFSPIINAPEVAILGVSKSVMEPVWDGKGFQPRLMLPLSLSWDHRVLDGASAARFNVYLGQILADFRRVLL